MKRLILLMLVLLLVCVNAALSFQEPETSPVYVDINSPGPNFDGTSWDTAYHTVASALADTRSTDHEVWVAAGTYNESNLSITGKKVFGGFKGTESSRYLRDWTLQVTIVDGTGSNPVILLDGDNAEIDGFIIGNSNNPIAGDGIRCISGSPVIAHNNITRKNHAIYCQGGTAKIAHNIIYCNNDGIVCGALSPYILNNTIVDNVGTTAAISYTTGQPIIKNNIIASNEKGLDSGCANQNIKNNCIFANVTNFVGIAPDTSAGSGNLLSDPCFMDQDSCNYHLDSISPCIDSGDRSVYTASCYDVEGNIRMPDPAIVNAYMTGLKIDIGAYEAPRSVILNNYNNWFNLPTDDYQEIQLLAMHQEVTLTELRHINPLDLRKLNPRIKVYALYVLCTKPAWDTDVGGSIVDGLWVFPDDNNGTGGTGTGDYSSLQCPVHYADIIQNDWWLRDDGDIVGYGSERYLDVVGGWSEPREASPPDNSYPYKFTTHLLYAMSNKGYTGVVFDYVWPNIQWVLSNVNSNGTNFQLPLDNYGSPIEDGSLEWKYAWLDFLGYVANELHQNGYSIVLNCGGSYADHTDPNCTCDYCRWFRDQRAKLNASKGDGIIYEIWGVTSSGQWFSGTDPNHNENWQGMIPQSVYSFSADPLAAWTADCGLKTTTPYYDRKQHLCLAMYYTSIPQTGNQRSFHYYHDNDVFWNQLWDYNIGRPKDQNAVENPNYLWSRKYTNGLVLLNYNATSQAYTFDQAYVDNNGIIYGPGTYQFPVYTSEDNTAYSGLVLKSKLSVSVSINQSSSQPDPTVSSVIQFNAVFNSSVINFNAEDVHVGGTAKPVNVAVTNPSGDGMTYIISVSGMQCSGTVWASIPSNAALTEITKNGNYASTSTDNVVEYKASPVNVSVSPSSGTLVTGRKILVTTTYSDPDGCADIKGCYLNINATSSQLANSIYLAYSEQYNKLYLRKDDNTGWAIALGSVPGTDAVAANSRCKLYCAESTVERTADSITIHWMLEFSAPVAGQSLPMWMKVSEDSDMETAWEQKGSINFSTAPTGVSLTLDDNVLHTGTPHLLTSVYHDPHGYAHLHTVNLVLNDTPAGSNTLYVKYDVNTNRLHLSNDDGSSWSEGIAPGSANTLENGNCILYCGDTSVTSSGNFLTLDWKIELKSSMAGRTTNAWMKAWDDELLYFNDPNNYYGDVNGYAKVGSYIVIPSLNASVANVSIGAQDKAVSKWLLGSNITAKNHGCGLLTDNGQPVNSFDPWVLERAQELGPTILGYPNQFQYAWDKFSAEQVPDMYYEKLTPSKFMDFCQQIGGADALFSVRTYITYPNDPKALYDYSVLPVLADEAARWVNSCKNQWDIKGWQIGNEDYWAKEELFRNLPTYVCIVNAADDTITFRNHGFADNDTLSFTTSAHGLYVNTLYYVRKTNDDQFQVCLSKIMQDPIDIDSTGAMQYTTTLLKINRVHWYRQALNRMVPALKNAGATNILAQAWPDRWGHNYSGAAGIWNGHLVANFNDMVINEFGNDIDGLAVHYYAGPDLAYPIRLSFYGDRNICEAFTVPTSGLYTVKARAYGDNGHAHFRVKIGNSATSDVNGTLIIGNVIAMENYEALAYDTPEEGKTPPFHEYTVDVYLEAGTRYIDISRYSPDNYDGEKPLVLGTAVIRKKDTSDPWVPIWLTHHDGWKWVFAKNASYEDELSWLESYGKPIWATEGSSGWNSNYKQSAIQRRVGAALVCAQQIGLFARHGVKCRMQWDLLNNYTYGSGSWNMIDGYTHRNLGNLNTGEIIRDVDPRGQLMQFLNEEGVVDGGYYHSTTTTSQQDAFWTYPERSGAYYHYNLIDATAIKNNGVWKVLIINLHHSQDAVINMSGLGNGPYNGSLRVLKASSSGLPNPMLDGQEPTLLDAWVFDAPTQATISLSGSSMGVSVPPASVAVLTLNP